MNQGPGGIGFDFPASPPATTPAPTTPGSPGNPGNVWAPPPVPPAAGTPGATPTFQSLFDQQFGTGNPFGSPTFQNFSDLQNAVQRHANYELQKNLGETRAHFGGMGLGSSSREALAEGSAIGESQSHIEDTLAQLANQARTGDLDRALSALGLGASTSLAEQKLPLEALQMLMGGGENLYAGARGDLPHLLDLILPFLTAFGQNSQQGFTR